MGIVSLGTLLTRKQMPAPEVYMNFNSQAALTYQWSPANRFSNSAIQNPTVFIDSTRTYYLETTINFNK
jgi:hypothetical protein